MWGPGWWGPMWGFGWIFPLMGFVMCLLFVVMMIRARGRGRGFMCVGGHDLRPDETAELRREIRELREEIGRLKTR